MKKRKLVWLPLFVLAASCPAALAQANAQPQKTKTQSAQSSASDTQKKNVQEYIELLRTNVRQQKSEIMGAVMALSADDAAKFWPIYSDYDAELTKLNKLRVQNIQDYAQNYMQMTDEKADQLIQSALDYQSSALSFLQEPMIA